MIIRFSQKHVEAMPATSTAWACQDCPHVTIGKDLSQAQLLADAHAGRHGANRAELVPMFDAFDAWMAAAGEPATELIDGAEAIVEGPATIADFAFAIEVAAGAAMGKLFA